MVFFSKRRKSSSHCNGHSASNIGPEFQTGIYNARMVFPGKPYGTIGTFTHGTQNFITPIGFTLHIGRLQIGFWG